jgi:HEAT repeat protein
MQALDALRTYERGSPRGLLRPIDQAASEASARDDQAPARLLENRLLLALESARSFVAREYICSQLRLIGSVASVRAMAALLSDVELGTAARNVLEAIPHPAAGKALVASLSSLEGVSLIGAINSLGAIAAPGPERGLARKLRDSNPDVVSAATAALGEIGSAKSAKILRALLGTVPSTQQPQVTDAAWTCSERLRAQGKDPQAKALEAKIPRQ